MLYRSAEETEVHFEQVGQEIRATVKCRFRKQELFWIQLTLPQARVFAADLLTLADAISEEGSHLRLVDGEAK